MTLTLKLWFPLIFKVFYKVRIEGMWDVFTAFWIIDNDLGVLVGWDEGGFTVQVIVTWGCYLVRRQMGYVGIAILYSHFAGTQLFKFPTTSSRLLFEKAHFIIVCVNHPSHCTCIINNMLLCNRKCVTDAVQFWLNSRKLSWTIALSNKPLN